MERCAFCERPINEDIGVLRIYESTPTLEKDTAFCSHLCAAPWLAVVIRDMSLRMPRR